MIIIISLSVTRSKEVNRKQLGWPFTIEENALWFEADVDICPLGVTCESFDCLDPEPRCGCDWSPSIYKECVNNMDRMPIDYVDFEDQFTRECEILAKEHLDLCECIVVNEYSKEYCTWLVRYGSD